jgi:hypothetical protein
VEALKKRDQATLTTTAQTSPQDDSLKDAVIGNPISHGQIVDLWKDMGDGEYSLEKLLRGARVYVPPPPPKVEPVRLGFTHCLLLGAFALPSGANTKVT